ncbi:hypothetical protein GCM10010468_25980 [Actinocorallia longicatena]|uniref:HTH merR-type domain-containing protein n=2 Tax=Actinocorallia longicatena TaxID=111803 RepID=A0ABP6QA25_9ACTN
MPPPARSATGQRVYGPRDVTRVRLIRQLLERGLTIEDVRSCADRLELVQGETLPPHNSSECSVSGVVARRLSVLDAEIARLTALRENLAGTVRPAGQD